MMLGDMLSLLTVHSEHAEHGYVFMYSIYGHVKLALLLL